MTTKNQTNEDPVTTMGITIAQGIFFILLAGIFLMLTLSVSLAKVGRRLREDGESWKEILKTKLLFLAGILPVVIIIALGVGYFKVQEKLNPEEKNYPKTEAEFRELVEEKHEAFKEAGWNLDGKRSELRYAKEEQGSLKNDIRRARAIEEQSRIEEDYLANEDEILTIKGEIESLAPLVTKKKEELRIARQNLKSFREGTFRRPVLIQSRSMPAKDQFWIYFKYIQLSLRYMAGSFLLSFLFMFIWPQNNKKLEAFSDFSHRFWEIVSAPGMMIINMVGSFFGETPARRKSSSNDIMKLGSHRMAYLTDKNLNYHTQIIGGSGAGKTNLLKVMIEDRIRKGHGLIFLTSKLI
jgi:hypothetical protein